MPKDTGLQYEDREKLDNELAAALDDILAAETQARHIIEKAYASVNAIQLDGAAQERAMRETYVKRAAAERESKIAAARKNAEIECARLTADAKARGETFLKEKRGAIEERAKELFKQLVG